MASNHNRFSLLFGLILVLSSCKNESAGTTIEASRLAPQPAATQRVASSAAVAGNRWEKEYGGAKPGMGDYSSAAISTARTLEEAQWLKRQGFLSRTKIQSLRELGFEELDKLARAGNHDAILFIGERLVAEGRGNLIAPALDQMIESSGSIPALELRARYKSSKVLPGPGQIPTSSWEWREATIASTLTKVDVAADYFAAYILGDYRGSQVVASMFSIEEGVPPLVYTEAMKRVAMIADARRTSGKPPIHVDPRPIPEGVRGAMEPF